MLIKVAQLCLVAVLTIGVASRSAAASSDHSLNSHGHVQGEDISNLRSVNKTTSAYNTNAASLGLFAPALTWRGYALGEDISNLHGGLKVGSIFNINGELVANYNLKSRFNHNALVKFGVLGATYTRYQEQYTNAIQAPSAFLSPRLIRISDLSYQYNWSEKNKFIIGIMDMNDNFNITEAANNLLNNAFCNTATLYANTQLATFPFPGFGTMGSVTKDKTTIMLGLYQGNPQHLSTLFYKGYTAIAEIDHAFDRAFSKDTTYSIKGGVWMYQQSDPSVVLGTNARGLYLITQANWNTQSTRILSGFINLGYSNQDTRYVPYSLALGLRSDSIFFGKKDSLSVGMGKIWIANKSSEVAYELSYAAEVYRGLEITPDVQYIIKPNGISPNALVVMLRLAYIFG